MRAFLFAIALTTLTACGTAPKTSTGIDLAGMDKSVAPGDDFNAYANSGWDNTTPSPCPASK